jgi:hypothetical protein
VANCALAPNPRPNALPCSALQGLLQIFLPCRGTTLTAPCPAAIAGKNRARKNAVYVIVVQMFYLTRRIFFFATNQSSECRTTPALWFSSALIFLIPASQLPLGPEKLLSNLPANESVRTRLAFRSFE